MKDNLGLYKRVKMKLLKDVMDNYLILDANLPSKKANKDLSRPDHYAIFKAIPKLFNDWILQTANSEGFKYGQKSSIGAGNKARIPWVCVYNLAITETVQQGYYIALLFSEDMSRVYLSLNQGVTKAEFADTQLFASKALDYLGTNDRKQNLIYGRINLSASNNRLGEGYERSAIKSYEYHLGSLPTEDQFKNNFLDLLNDYNSLFKFAKQSLASLNPLSESTYQEDIQKPLEYFDIQAGGLPIPELKNLNNKSYVRMVKYAQKALREANYKCEIDSNHTTFLTRHNHNYMEGHHFIPMSQQSKFNYSLDVPENIISLCPTCHRALHHGDAKTIIPMLEKLWSVRKQKLIKRKIQIKFSDIKDVYIKMCLENNLD